MDSRELSDMTRHEVRRHEQRLREHATRISEEGKAAKADGVGRMWISRETGVDMSFEFEHWRRWAALANEMHQANAEFVADLGAARVEYWHGALNPEALQPPRPLRAYQPAVPLVRRVAVPPRAAFRPPVNRASQPES